MAIKQSNGAARTGEAEGKNWSRWVNLLGEYGFIVTFILWAIFLTLFTKNFATVNNILTVLRQASVIGIVAIGAHYIILLGDMDLSVATNLTLSGVIMAALMVNQEFTPILAIMCSLLVGAIIGLANGLIITQLKINAIIATLGMMSILQGIASIITSGKTIFGDQLDSIEFLSRSSVLDIIPTPVVILFIFYIAAFIVLRRTIFGARVFAVGNNSKAAWLSGINVNAVKVMTFMLTGALAAFGGVMQVARQGTATSTMGGDFLFPILTAVVLGGASLTGGRGKIFNTLIAGIYLTTITNGMVLLGIDINAQRVISGLILVVALSLDRLRTLRL